MSRTALLKCENNKWRVCHINNSNNVYTEEPIEFVEKSALEQTRKGYVKLDDVEKILRDYMPIDDYEHRVEYKYWSEMIDEIKKLEGIDVSKNKKV